MSLALYRKYRPGTFAELVGQDHVTDALRQALRNDRVHHAYLFSGPRGCGKTSSARILARSLNCEQGPTPDPCGGCAQCVAIANGSSLDVVEIDAASHGGVDDARDLRERAFFSPVSARRKVYIVDEAHMVSKEGFNALLKLVEEPPDHLTFVFATTEPEKVIGTIRSRTHHYPFRLVPPKILSTHLASICEREGAKIDPRALPLVVRAGAGSVRDALSVLDQLLAGAGPDGLTYDVARGLLGVTDSALLDDVVEAFAARDGAAVFASVGALVDAGHDPRRFAADLLDRFRDLLVLQRVPDAAERDLLDAPPDLLPRLGQQADAFGPAELSRAADLLYAGLTEMRGTTSPRLVLEMVCARVLLPAAATDDASVLARLDRLERRLEIGGTPEPAPLPKPKTAPKPEPVAAAPAPPAAPAAPAAPAPEPVTGDIDAAAIRRHWPDIREAVRKRKRTAEALLADAQVTAADPRGITLEFKHDFHARSFTGGVHVDYLREAITEVLGVDWPVVATVRAEGATTAEPVFVPEEDEDVSGPGDDPVALLASGLGAKVISDNES